jgi:hypothetical protein
VVGSERLPGALLDCVTHRVQIVLIRGDSSGLARSL